MIRNSANDYGAVAKWLHWLTALLFLGSYVSVYYRHWFTEKQTPENWTALQIHLSIGVTLAVLVVLRIVWRCTQRQPDPPPGSAMEHRVAHLGHMGLYAMMIIMPITGYLGTGVATDYFFVFEIQKFADTALFQSVVSEGWNLSFETFEAPMDFVHKTLMGEWLVWLLILGHAGAALFHHFKRRDRTLIRMTTGKA